MTPRAPAVGGNPNAVSLGPAGAPGLRSGFPRARPRGQRGLQRHVPSPPGRQGPAARPVGGQASADGRCTERAPVSRGEWFISPVKLSPPCQSLCLGPRSRPGGQRSVPTGQGCPPVCQARPRPPLLPHSEAKGSHSEMSGRRPHGSAGHLGDLNAPAGGQAGKHGHASSGVAEL